MKKKQLYFSISSSLLILATGIFLFLQMKEQYEENKQIGEACLNQEGTVIMEREAFFLMSKTSCETH
ncbi:hypothetical protein ACU3L3_16640 [Priestia endophytica]|jgi:hypothetical protein|uniref:Uncharacterized protein n=1 Tax=Priestia endophytica DSM 13796 TaxID=1121089 RepID=A0A1I5YS85_9BACI|nr:hypothetical protein [Priestia endophytica]KAB2495299.1 hypothetical protein F8155_04730 [Priestia endophytica]KYG26314.1 hypothetical protein AZF06_17500 [Priestia endophytica]MBG9813933.1 hypothetical protein [Priestia endophytica]RAS86084.1 hypothetical protein A4R27_02655 [Priestia endophytica]SFQ46915.1 hypothetical protein SAMN02745910_01516 [Priestia endophytica DSM 13796]